jgi:predicted transcriptional regulator of viral defense system
MHDTKGTKPDRDKLFRTASEQSGYFTAAQARSAGFSWALLTHHSKGGRFIRVRQGLYRFREYPSSPREDVMAAWLAAGADVAVVSHESALDILGLSDVVPEAVHLTVPRPKRYRPASPGVTVHTTTRPIRSADVVVRDGIKVSAPARAVVDAAEAGTAPEQIVAAVAQAIERGMATESQLLAAAQERGGRVERLVSQAIEERGRVP